MATNRTFQAMLNEYLPESLLKEELVKKDYLFNKVEKDDGWKGGNLVVPFKASGASSIAFGSLSASNDISEDLDVRGNVSYYKEVWGSMIFNHKDLLEHDGKVNEKSFLKILPDQIDDFMDWIRNAVSVNMLGGPHFATLTVSGTVGGVITVDRVDRFAIGQKVILKDNDTAAAAAYVTSISIDANTVNLVTTRGGVTAFDASAYTTGQAAKVYHDGASTASNAFSSLRSMLLSAANGGDSTIFGVTKTLYPFLQAPNVNAATIVDGGAITAANILDGIFNAFTRIRQVGKGAPDTVLMSYKHLGSVMRKLESQKGPYNIKPQNPSTKVYGWTEVVVIGVKGELTLVGLQEMDDDIIMFIDWRALKFYSNGMFRKRTAPDGKQYFESRATSGYQYILDISLFGELVLLRPSYCGILYGISY